MVDDRIGPKVRLMYIVNANQFTGDLLNSLLVAAVEMVPI